MSSNNQSGSARKVRTFELGGLLEKKVAKKQFQFTKKTIWTQSNKKWRDTTSFSYPEKEQREDFCALKLEKIDFWKNLDDIGIEGIQMTYSDGHKSELFKTQTKVEKELTLTVDILKRTRYIQAFGAQPREKPGYITRLLLQDSKQAILEDWKPDFIQSGDDRHVSGPRLEICPNEEIIGMFGSKQDATDCIFELGFVCRPKSGKTTLAKLKRQNVITSSELDRGDPSASAQADL